MEKLKSIMNRFASITTCQIVAAGFFTTICYHMDFVLPQIFWQILLVSMLCAVSTLIFPDTAISTKKAIILSVIHYFIIVAIVLGFGYLFEWFYFTSARKIIFMISSITIIYVYISAISWKRSMDEAKKMNECLKEYQNEK